MKIHRLTKTVFISGIITVLTVIVASAVFYFGAGKITDYRFCVDLCESLLAYSRPTAVLFCVASLLTEYREKQKANNR